MAGASKARERRWRVKPLRLMLINYLGFRGTHSLDLHPIRCAAVVGPNGSGKSSLFEAMRFSLFGYCRVPRDLNWAVNEAEQVAKVEYEYSLGDQRFLVGRERSKAGRGKSTLWYHLLTENGPVVLDGKTIGETQQKIIDSLHMTDELFRITACGSQRDELELTDVDRSKRRDVLGSIVIPDPLIWDRRAEMAGKMARGCEADRQAKAQQTQGAEQQAANRDTIEQQITEVAQTIESCQTLANTAEAAITDRAAEREKLLTERATDEAARTSLVEFQQRQHDATSATETARKRLDALTAQVAGKAAVSEALSASERAASEAAEMEAGRQERERLGSRGKELDAHIAAAKSAHTSALKQLETQITAAKDQHALGLKSRKQHIAQLAKQADPLGSAKCVTEGNTAFSESCVLIAQAREAKAMLPGAQEDLRRFEAATSWTEDEARLAEVQGQTPAADLIVERDEVARQWKAVAYDLAAHAELKARAAGLADHQRALALIEAAEQQMPDAQAALEKVTADLSDLQSRISALATSLGPARDWASELAALDKLLADNRAELARIRRQLEIENQRQGGLTAQLDAAVKAAEQIEALRAEIAEIDRRANLLGILGDAYAKSGIPALLVEQAVPELEAAANEVLTLLSDGQLSVAFRTQRENKDGSIAEALDIIVYGPNGERPYESFSGGQAVRVAIAVRCGTSELVAGRSGARCEMLILDEPKWLDDHGQDVLVDCLARLSDRFQTILLATHSDRLKDAFPQRIEVSRGTEGSRVEVIQ